MSDSDKNHNEVGEQSFENILSQVEIRVRKLKIEGLFPEVDCLEKCLN